jgi:penicillin-binding protein 1C
MKVSADSSISYCGSCAPAAGYAKKWYKVLAPEMQDYLSQNGAPYQAIPAHNPVCEKVFKGDGPSITSPLNGSEYYMSKDDPEPLQLTAGTSNDVSFIWWYINDRFYKKTRAREKIFFMPEEGSVKVSCTDDKGRNRNIWIKVKYISL